MNYRSVKMNDFNYLMILVSGGKSNVSIPMISGKYLHSLNSCFLFIKLLVICIDLINENDYYSLSQERKKDIHTRSSLSFFF